MGNRPYAYGRPQKGRPRVLGVKRGTATCAIAKHAASGPTPACHTAGLAPGPPHWLRGWAPMRSASTTRARSVTSLDPQHGVRCYGDVMSMHKVYSWALFYPLGNCPWWGVVLEPLMNNADFFFLNSVHDMGSGTTAVDDDMKTSRDQFSMTTPRWATPTVLLLKKHRRTELPSALSPHT